METSISDRGGCNAADSPCARRPRSSCLSRQGAHQDGRDASGLSVGATVQASRVVGGRQQARVREASSSNQGGQQRSGLSVRAAPKVFVLVG